MGTHVLLSPGGHSATLTVVDDIDHGARPGIERAACALPRSVDRLTLDLERVAFVDSALLHLLTSLDRACAVRGGLLRVVGLRPQPRRLLALAADLRPADRWERYLTAPSPN